eukprot:g177.t1
MSKGEDEKMLKDAVESSWISDPFAFGVSMHHDWETSSGGWWGSPGSAQIVSPASIQRVPNTGTQIAPLSAVPTIYAGVNVLNESTNRAQKRLALLIAKACEAAPGAVQKLSNLGGSILSRRGSEGDSFRESVRSAGGFRLFVAQQSDSLHLWRYTGSERNVEKFLVSSASMIPKVDWAGLLRYENVLYRAVTSSDEAMLSFSDLSRNELCRLLAGFVSHYSAAGSATLLQELLQK